MQSRNLLIVLGVILFVGVVIVASSTYVVPPGHRGVKVTLGKVAPDYLSEGFGLRAPFITTVENISIRQQTREMVAECYSSDLQQINMRLRVLYRIPQDSAVAIYQQYEGDPFESLVAPRVHEALKEVSAQDSAEQVVKKREEIKTKAFEQARKKVGDLIEIRDIVLEDISLSTELEQAIEAKMVQEQEAAKAKFVQDRAQIDADTAIIRGTGEAESIRIRGKALRENPEFIDLQIVERWDGKSPLVVGDGANGANMLLPIEDVNSPRTRTPRANASTPPSE